MNKTELIDAIKRRLGRRTDLDADIELEMDLAQTTYLERNGRVIAWFLPFTVGDLPTVAGVDTVSIPVANLVDLGNFVGIPEHGGYFLKSDADSDWSKLTKGLYDTNLAKYQDAEGFPCVYSTHSTDFRLRPIPDAVYLGRLAYTSGDPHKPSALAPTETNLWGRHAPELLIYQTAQLCARDLLQDFELAMSFEGTLKASWDRLMVETERREHEDREYFMGSHE